MVLKSIFELYMTCLGHFCSKIAILGVQHRPLRDHNFFPGLYDDMLQKNIIVRLGVDNPPRELEGLKFKTYS